LNRFSRFILPLLIAAGVTACKKEPHVPATEPVFRTAQSLHMVSRLWEMVHLTGTGKSAEVLPAGVRRKWIDSTLADMDGLEYDARPLCRIAHAPTRYLHLVRWNNPHSSARKTGV